VNRRRALLLAGAAVCAAISVLLALVAADVLRWRDVMEQNDLAAAGAAPAAWTHDETLPFGIARSLLGVDDDIKFRVAADLYNHAGAGILDDLDVEGANARLRAEAALARLMRDRSDAKRASRAATMLGVLQFRDALAPDSATPIDRAAGTFEEAVRLDPANDQARANLELVVREGVSRAGRRGPNDQSGGPRRASTTPGSKSGY
jgi:hypothetical protein